MKKDYVSKLNANFNDRIYVTDFGINVLIPKSQLEEMKSKGFVEGFTKPYINEIKETHKEE